MVPGSGWLGYLRKRRGSSVPRQLLHMMKLHRTPFESLLTNIYEATDEYAARYTFPLVASTAQRNPEQVEDIIRSPHEIACHGFRHISYKYLSERDQRIDIERGTKMLREMGIRIRGFRAPYNNYTEATPRILQGQDFLWDGGIGYREEYRELTRIFRIKIDGGESDFSCIPLSHWSDDRMIDIEGLDNAQMLGHLKGDVDRVARERGIIMFDLHPIRIGQPSYIDVLRELLAYATKLGGWFPTVTEAVEQWNNHGRWKGDSTFCCLLTGDIDNFTFSDYLLRLHQG